MRNELHHCTKPACWVNDLLNEGYQALWPLVLEHEKRDRYFVWTFYVRWRERRASHANKVWLCEKHHKQILAMWDRDMADDLRNMEATEQWLIQVDSQMNRKPTSRFQRLPRLSESNQRRFVTGLRAASS